MSRCFNWLAVVILAASTTAWAGGTVVVVPARINLVQAGMDLAARYGVTLVSYRGKASTALPLVHVWNGKEWKYVPLDAFQSGSFLSVKPTQTFIVGDEKMIPKVFAPMAAWAGTLQEIPSIFTPDILNAAGTALKFRKGDWQWFASRYNMKVEDANAAARNGVITQAVVVALPVNMEITESKKTDGGKPSDKPASETPATD